MGASKDLHAPCRLDGELRAHLELPPEQEAGDRHDDRGAQDGQGDVGDRWHQKLVHIKAVEESLELLVQDLLVRGQVSLTLYVYQLDVMMYLLVVVLLIMKSLLISLHYQELALETTQTSLLEEQLVLLPYWVVQTQQHVTITHQLTLMMVLV